MELIEKLKHLLVVATPEPWEFEKGKSERLDRRPAVITCYNHELEDWFIHGDITSLKDAELICFLRNNANSLIELVEQSTKSEGEACWRTMYEQERDLAKGQKDHLRAKIERLQVDISDKDTLIEFQKAEITNMHVDFELIKERLNEAFADQPDQNAMIYAIEDILGITEKYTETPTIQESEKCIHKVSLDWICVECIEAEIEQKGSPHEPT